MACVERRITRQTRTRKLRRGLQPEHDSLPSVYFLSAVTGFHRLYENRSNGADVRDTEGAKPRRPLRKSNGQIGLDIDARRGWLGYDKLSSGIVVPVPAFMRPYLGKRDGLEHIGPEDTWDGSYSRMLEAATARALKSVKGLRPQMELKTFTA